jgi:hypothetical protein
MTVILRWFDFEGSRHRAYFRSTRRGTRELVIAGGGWQVGLPDVGCTMLEELTDERLVELADHGWKLVAESPD